MLGLISKRKVILLLDLLYIQYDELCKFGERVGNEECRQRGLLQRGAINRAIEEIKELA